MSKFSKFLLVGAVTLAASTASFAQTISNDVGQTLNHNSQVTLLTQQEANQKEARLEKLANYFLNDINPIIQKQYAKGTLTEKAEILVHVTEGDSKELYNNYFYRKIGQCVVEVNFNEKGQTPSLGIDQELNFLTSAQNDLQQKMIREFIVLHEHNHCEFSNFDNPIQFKTKQENTKYVLQGLRDLSSIEIASNYSSVVNEGFADISASIALLKQYGIKNDNVLHILEGIKAQRKDTYIQTKLDSHFSHHALEELLKPENLNKINNMSDPNDIKQFALDLANKGAALTFYEKPTMRDATFHEKALFASVAAEAGRLLFLKGKNLADLEPGFEHPEKNYGPNLVSDLAHKILEEPSIKKVIVQYVQDDTNLKDAAEKMYEHMQLNRHKYQTEIAMYQNTMNELNQHIHSTVKEIIKPTKLFKEDYSLENVIKNVHSLRSEFLNNAKNKPKPTGWDTLKL